MKEDVLVAIGCIIGLFCSVCIGVVNFIGKIVMVIAMNTVFKDDTK